MEQDVNPKIPLDELRRAMPSEYHLYRRADGNYEWADDEGKVHDYHYSRSPWVADVIRSAWDHATSLIRDQQVSASEMQILRRKAAMLDELTKAVRAWRNAAAPVAVND